jgi:hypothetical protein
MQAYMQQMMQHMQWQEGQEGQFAQMAAGQDVQAQQYYAQVQNQGEGSQHYNYQ